jgi:hypothetical protein
MSSGTQIDLDWTGIDPTLPNGGYAGQASAPANASNGAGGYLTDEEILGIDPVGQTRVSVPEDAPAVAVASKNSSDVTRNDASRLEGQAGVRDYISHARRCGSMMPALRRFVRIQGIGFSIRLFQSCVVR